MLVVAVAPAGAAEAQPSLGEADGVRIHRQNGALVVTFTRRAARLYRRVAGRWVSVFCTELPREDERGVTTESGGGITMRAPKRRRPIRTGDRTRGMDYCRVWLEPRRVKGRTRQRRGRELIVSVPLTQRGAVHLDEADKARTLFALLSFAGLVAEEADASPWPTPAELIEEVGRRSSRLELVALAGPGDTPPPGAFGYYSNGQQHAAAVALSAAGRRLFVEHDADKVLRTNVVEYLFSDRY